MNSNQLIATRLSRLVSIAVVIQCVSLGGCVRHGDVQQTAQVELSENAGVVDYLVYFPHGYESKEESWPLVLFLHGAGECGDDIDLVKTHGLPRRIEEGAEFPFLVVSPQSRHHGWDVDELASFLDAIVTACRVDLDRIYVTGLSMGGFGTWRLAAYQPERFTAIAPICGGGDAENASRLVKLSIWAFHGTQDDVISVEATREMVEAVQAAGGNVRYTEYPDARHDCWTRTYENPELFEWLLEQQRR